ncbi:MAG: lipopolysaccharide biosynthesis protein RfbH [candidate division FCPU426 bacterium]
MKKTTTAKQKRLQQSKKILAAVKAYARLDRQAGTFRPGQDRVHYAGRVFDHQEITAMVKASLDSWVTVGPYGEELERALSRWLGVRNVILVNSGSSANLLAVAALCDPKLPNRLKAGDEVITPAVTFPTTVAPLLQHQLVPVFVDSRLEDYNIDISLLERALTAKTRAIMVPHTLGNPCHLERLVQLARRYRLFLIEDNCDALGSKYQGRLTGTFGELATLSFYPAHHMTMGEGGAVITNDPRLARIVRSLRDWGRDCWCGHDAGPHGACGKRLQYKIEGLGEAYDHRYVYTHIGYNLKPTDLQAALGLAQLKKVPGFIKARRRNFTELSRRLAPFERWLILPQPAPHSEPAWFAFPITVREDAGFSRQTLQSFLEERRIETRLLFAGNIVRQPAFRSTKYRVYGGLKNADMIMRRTFFIGVYPGLRSSHLRYIASVFGEFFKNRKRT